MEARQAKCKQIAASVNLREKAVRWLVPSQSGNGKGYVVKFTDAGYTCECPDWEFRCQHCKHILAVCVTVNRALVAVGERFPGFELAAVLVKAAAINQLYWTRVFAIGSAAQHIVNVMRESPAIDEALVERLAAVPKAPHHKQAKRSISFASKFAHVYLSEALPIYDWYADDTVRWHIGRKHAQSSDAHPYLAFAANVRTLWLYSLLNAACQDCP